MVIENLVRGAAMQLEADLHRATAAYQQSLEQAHQDFERRFRAAALSEDLVHDVMQKSLVEALWSLESYCADVAGGASGRANTT